MRHVTRIARAFAVVLALVAFSSCGKKAETTDTTTQIPPPETTPVLTDANIAAIVVAANTADIKNGEMAKTAASNPQVKAFAEQMVTDHTAVNKQATDLVTKLNVTPEDNDTSRMLGTNADATRANLQAQTGAAFDKAYVDNEVAYHEAVINMLDNTLIPSAQNPELKALLESARPAFVAHLDHAKQLQATLAK